MRYGTTDKSRRTRRVKSRRAFFFLLYSPTAKMSKLAGEQLSPNVIPVQKPKYSSLTWKPCIPTSVGCIFTRRNALLTSSSPIYIGSLGYEIRMFHIALAILWIDLMNVISPSSDGSTQSLMASHWGRGRNVESYIGRGGLYLLSMSTIPCGVRCRFGINGRSSGSTRIVFPRLKSLNVTFWNTSGHCVQVEWLP